jgi:hypothetical protein
MRGRLLAVVRRCVWWEREFALCAPNTLNLVRGCVWLLAGDFWPRWCSNWCSRWAGVRAQRCSGDRYTSACRRWLVVQRLANSGAKASSDVATVRTVTREVAASRRVQRSRPRRGVVLRACANRRVAYVSTGATNAGRLPGELLALDRDFPIRAASKPSLVERGTDVRQACPYTVPYLSLSNTSRMI